MARTAHPICLLKINVEFTPQHGVVAHLWSMTFCASQNSG